MVAPLAVKLAELPEQIAAGDAAVIVGVVFTVNTTDLIELQLAVVPVTTKV